MLQNSWLPRALALPPLLLAIASPLLRAQDFEEIKHHDGISPAWGYPARSRTLPAPLLTQRPPAGSSHPQDPG